MSLTSIRTWQWMVLSLLVGAALGEARTRAEGDLAAYLGRGINGQRAFEEALLAVEQGRPRFADVSVHTRSVPDGRGGIRRAFVVAGSYFDGHYQQKEGKAVAEWRPAFFLCDASAPYKPAVPWDRLGRPDLRGRFEAIARPTVTDFLDCVAEARGVSWTRAWWLGRGVAEWTAASFVVLGLLWPACVNLLAFGSLRRPPREKGTDLSRVKARPAPATADAPVAGVDLERLHELEAEMERDLESEAAVPAPVAAAAPAPPRELKTEPLAPAPAPAASEGPGYGTGENDYYPTVLHPPGAKPGDPLGSAIPARPSDL